MLTNFPDNFCKSLHRSTILIGSSSKPYQICFTFQGHIFQSPLHPSHIFQGILQVQIQLIPLFTFTFVTYCCCFCCFPVLAAAVAVAPMLAINIIACCRSVHQFVCLGVRVCVSAYNEIKHNKRQNKF